jgi:hypothetical protein
VGQRTDWGDFARRGGHTMTAEQIYSAHFFALMDFIIETYPLLDVTYVLTRMQVDLKSCNAVTNTGFKKWAHAYAKRAADEMLDQQVSSLEDVVAIAQRQDTGEKPPFIYQQHPTRSEITFVKIARGRGGRDSHVWIVPTDKLGLVQILHPTVSVRFTRIANRRYAYLIKKCQRQNYNGSWTTVERDLAGIWLGTDRPIEAVDGNYCNYLPENLRIFWAKSEDALDRAVHPLWDEKDANPEDWKPDAPTATARAANKVKDTLHDKPMNTYDITVSRWLRGDSTLRASDVAIEMRTINEAADTVIAPVAVDLAAKQLRQAWRVES